MQKFRPSQLRVGSASQRRGKNLPHLIPFEAEDSVYWARHHAIPATRSKGQILASPGIKFPVDSVQVEDVLPWVVGCLTFRDLGSVFFVVNIVIMSSSRRSGKEVATSSQKKCSRSGNVPLAHVVSRGQTRRFGAKAITKEGEASYKKHTEASYFSDVWSSSLLNLRSATCTWYESFSSTGRLKPNPIIHRPIGAGRAEHTPNTRPSDTLCAGLSPWLNGLSTVGRDIINLFPTLTCFGRYVFG
ncbi:hypothetical protein H5410_045946 [Solanum commersonii]|uniref:Uncharacterized protein n=1 Tax=Solanum commersonii TaxID=4109 RepID=A0A9J5XF45_SOLCO|nr:hypothetical protein H5410_045946 [Solanum commersonii]